MPNCIYQLDPDKIEAIYQEAKSKGENIYIALWLNNTRGITDKSPLDWRMPHLSAFVSQENIKKCLNDHIRQYGYIGYCLESEVSDLDYADIFIAAKNYHEKNTKN